MTFSYSVSVNDSGELIDDSALSAIVQAAASEWSRYISGLGSLDVQVNVIPTTRANASAATVVYLDTVGSNRIFELATVNELKTGFDSNGASPDLIINVDPDYVRTLWFDPSAFSIVPFNRTDGLSVFMHEIGHGLGILGYRDPVTGVLGGNETPWDRHVTLNADGTASFGGYFSKAVYGAAVPITTLQNGQQYNHIGNDVGEPAGQDLMNGVAFLYGKRYEISDLDLAIVKDIGLTVSMVVGDYSTTRPVVVSKTTFALAGDVVTGSAGVEGTGALSGSSDADILQLFKVNLAISALDGGPVGQSLLGTYGHLALNEDGSYTYAADRDAAIAAGPQGTHLHDVFSYIVSNGYGGSTASTLDVVLNRAAVVHEQVGFVTAEGIALGTSGTAGTGALSGFSDPDNDAMLISAVAGQAANVGNSVAGQYGHLILYEDGSYIYKLDYDASILNTEVYEIFNFNVYDGYLATKSADLKIAVIGNHVNNPHDEGNEASRSGLNFRMSGDAYIGDAQFIVKIDGQEVGGVQTTHASHAQGQSEDITLKGDFTGARDVSITFINDAYNGPGQDRNLYVDQLSVNGHVLQAESASSYGGVTVADGVALYGNGTGVTFDVSHLSNLPNGTLV